MFVSTYLQEVSAIANQIDRSKIEMLAMRLVELRNAGGRLFLLGVGGSAANCSHAVNDFRKLCGIQAYAPTDNVSELTARTNDEGWETVFRDWLRVSNINGNDAVFILSVGGGDRKKNVSTNLILAIDEAKNHGAKIYGIVGKDGGYAKEAGDLLVMIPVVNSSRITPHSEAFQAVIWHCLVSHPCLQINPTKW